MTIATLENLKIAVNDGSIDSVNSETIKKYLILLSQSDGPFAPKQEHVVIGNTLNHILLQRHIDSLNKQNSRTQRWFMVFAVISAIGAVGPYLMPPATPPIQIVVAQPSRPQQQSAPTQAQPQVSDQAKNKAP
jgi:hypothetical protein